MSLKKIAYIYSESLKSECDRLPTMLNRASMVQDLIESYGILSSDKLSVVESLDATEDELKLFHSSSYIEFLKKFNKATDLEQDEEEQLEYGLGYDCPLLERNYDFVKTVAGGSLSGAKLLAGNKCNIAINWFGGWHHAHRDSADGFCYVNDVVLAIQKLSEKFEKILYLDLDIHHGDGVQYAFEASKKILTLSIHKLIPGFYPGTGLLDDLGIFKGKYYAINVPLREAVNSKTYLRVFKEIFPKVFEAFKPDALVVQCGADGLHGDKVGEWNLTPKAIGLCVETVLNCKVPTLFLGGGGYNFANTARLWTYLTSIIIGQALDEDIPDSSQYFTSYQPTYELHFQEGNEKDGNCEDYLNRVISTVLSYVEIISR